MSEEPDRKEGIPLPIWVGLALTFLLIGGAIWSASGSVCDNAGSCLSRWQVLRNAPSNEIGDTLSGIGSALAFIWLVITAWMQSQELREQRRELRQQRKEWEKISAAQDAQVGILERQGEIFADELQQRVWVRSDSTVRSLAQLYLQHTAKWIEDYKWTSVSQGNQPMLSYVRKHRIASDLSAMHRSSEDVLFLFRDSINFTKDALHGLLWQGDFITERPKHPGRLSFCASLLDQIALLTSETSPSTKVILQHCALETCREKMHIAMMDERLWHEVLNE